MDEMRKLIIIAVVGGFVAAIFYLEELLTETTHNIDNIRKLGAFKIAFLVFANAIFGAVIMVTTFYGILNYFPDINQYLAGGVATSISFMGKDSIRIFHKLIKRKADDV
ncbi:MAG: hypothetical protein U9N61_09780 [Euryarchaeota archaeon]|nr:hypothetical protein [Euryarchaeota archaeon]